jgi:hypothetical protein
MSGPERMKELEEMDEFERSLTRALKRVDVRADTTAKFFAIVEEAERERQQTGRMWVTPKTGGKLLFMPRSMFRSWIGGAVAAVLAVGVFVGVHERQERKAEVARQQFDTAMRVTDHALDQTRAQLQRVGLNLE